MMCPGVRCPPLPAPSYTTARGLLTAVDTTHACTGAVTHLAPDPLTLAVLGQIAVSGYDNKHLLLVCKSLSCSPRLQIFCKHWFVDEWPGIPSPVLLPTLHNRLDAKSHQGDNLCFMCNLKQKWERCKETQVSFCVLCSQVKNALMFFRLEATGLWIYSECNLTLESFDWPIL